MSITKKCNHGLRLIAHRKGGAFVVCGFPRSGTTLLSEIVSLTSEYCFDRNNSFPTTTPVVWHTHWRPSLFDPKLSLCIIRNPIDVASSFENYSTHYKLNVKPVEVLRRASSLAPGWLGYYQAALECGISVVRYENLVNRSCSTINVIASKLAISEELVRSAIDHSAMKHRYSTHHIDKALDQHKHSSEVSRLSLEEKFEVFREEVEFYEALK